MRKFLSSSDAALILSVTPAAVRQMARRGDLPVAAKTQSGIRLFDEDDVIRLAEAREQKSAPDGED